MSRYSVLLFGVIFSLRAFAQHDPGRNAVRLLAQGKTDSAVATVQKGPGRMSSPISDAERHFVLTMVACKEGDMASAITYAKRAVDLGLPIGRLQAGPRNLFSSLHAQGEFQSWMQKPQKQLIHGPLLGSMTDSSARFWVRTAEETDVQIEVTPPQGGASAAKLFPGKARSSRESDYTAVIKVLGLKPDSQYRYHVLVNGQRAGKPAVFRTYPREGSPVRVRVGFGGGAGFTPDHERMWTTIAKRNLHALLLLGDNVYIDDPAHLLTHRYIYYRRQSQPEWRHLVASTSIYAIYDDHDFGDNDCVPGPDVESPEWKRKVWEVFKENWNNPAYGGEAKQPGCWFDFYIGDVHFVVLDGRYYRDLEGGSMLGPFQRKWLFETLKSSKGKFKVMASPVAWSPGVKPGSKDTWDGFPEEREAIFSFVEKHRIDGILLMAADRHRSDMRKISRANGYDLYEVMSSRLTNVHTHRLVEDARGSEFIMGYNEKCSFGLLSFDTTLADPEIVYEIVNIDNETVDSRSLKLSQLSCKMQTGNEQKKKRE